MKNFRTIILLILICLISFVTLSYQLTEVPSGIYVDEATTGYNAYSILKTGKDEYGKYFPIALRFFGSYTPPLYTYLTTIPIFIFELNEFSTRLISVICGVLMVLIIYKFLQESRQLDNKIIFATLVLFTFTPWNFFFARIGYELYLGFFLFYLGSLLCWMSLRKPILLNIGLIILSLATYAAHPQIYSVPLFISGFIVLFYKQINKRYLFVGLIISLVTQIPHLMLLGTKAFLNKSDLFYLDEILINAEKIALPGMISIPLSFGFSFFSRLINYFSPSSLFFLSDPDPQRSIPEISVFYNWMVVPFLIGVFLIFKNLKQKFIKLLLLLIFVSVLPASLTKDPFSTQRALGLLLPFFLIICFGISYLYRKINKKFFYACFSLIFMVSLLILWRSYFILLPAERALIWNYGYKELAKIISENIKTTFVIEQTKPVYIELAFFLKLNPTIFQNITDQKVRSNYYTFNSFNPDYKFENIETRKIEWAQDIYKNQILVADSLVISEPQAKEHFLEEVFAIKDPRGYVLLKGYKTNPEKKCRNTNNKSEYCPKLETK